MPALSRTSGQGAINGSLTFIVASTTGKLLQTWQALCEAAKQLESIFVKLVLLLEHSANLQINKLGIVHHVEYRGVSPTILPRFKILVYFKETF